MTQPLPKANDLLTVPEVIAYLRLGRNRVYRLIRERTIKSVRLSQRGTRVRRREVEAYLAHLEAEQNRPVINPDKLRLARQHAR